MMTFDSKGLHLHIMWYDFNFQMRVPLYRLKGLEVLMKAESLPFTSGEVWKTAFVILSSNFETEHPIKKFFAWIEVVWSIQ